MSSVRQCVEWSFGKVITLFGYLDFSRSQVLFRTPVAVNYRVGVLLTNCHTCY